MYCYFGLFVLFLTFAFGENVYSLSPVEGKVKAIKACREEKCSSVCSASEEDDPKATSACGRCVIINCSPKT